MTKEKLIQKQPFKGKTAILCGASQGMGKAIAKEFVKLGGSTLIIARRQEPLVKAAEEIKEFIKNDSQFVEHISCDATNLEKLKPILDKFVSNRGVPEYLFKVVGYALPKYFEEYTLEDFKNNMNINYYGQLVPSMIILPYFIKQRKGHFVNFSSVMGFMGIMGYGSYAPTKYAIVGLSEVMRHELKPYNIKVSIVYPPDTNTPGLTTENEGKPKECMMLSESGGIIEAEEVAESVIKGVLKNKFHIGPGSAGSIRYISRHLPKLVRWFVDRDYKKARKKVGRR